ncbi:MAG TPA: redoxin domain-containing protein [Anaerolineales bacterium]|nr:redoxin domain-containing protein [Anaerolineales bacterium]
MLIGESAPDFALPDLHGTNHRLSDQRGKIVIVNFWSCECPHCERTDQALTAMLVQWAQEVRMLSIASNRSESLPSISAASRARHLPLVLIDADHFVADLYEAQTTPHVFAIDRDGILRYRGAVDDVTFRQRRPARFFLDEAVEALLQGHFPALAETPAYGCSIVREI